MIHTLKEISINAMQIFFIITTWELFNRWLILIKTSKKSELNDSPLYYFCYIGMITVVMIIVIVAMAINSFITIYFSTT